jgi:small subunit ribosomal protein S1
LKINPFGAFIELDKDIHGLAHISELSDHIINSPEDVVAIGGEYDFTIINLESKDHRLGLSLKTFKPKKEKKEEGEDSKNKESELKDLSKPEESKLKNESES